MTLPYSIYYALSNAKNALQIDPGMNENNMLTVAHSKLEGWTLPASGMDIVTRWHL
jgi:hypothetical protein